MAEHTLIVPGEYAEDFRVALVEELAFDIRSFRTARKELTERIEREQPANDGDVRAIARQLEHDAALVQEADLSGEGEVTVRSEDASALQHICETMAHKVIAPRLADAVACSPLDARYVGSHVRPLIEALSWATEQSAQLEGKWQADRANEAA